MSHCVLLRPVHSLGVTHATVRAPVGCPGDKSSIGLESSTPHAESARHVARAIRQSCLGQLLEIVESTGLLFRRYCTANGLASKATISGKSSAVKGLPTSQF